MTESCYRVCAVFILKDNESKDSFVKFANGENGLVVTRAAKGCKSIDMYESKESGAVSESGTTITGNIKYLSVNNRPKFCTVPDIVQMIKGMMGGEYVYGPISLEKAIENIKGYGGTENNINKAIALI